MHVVAVVLVLVVVGVVVVADVAMYNAVAGVADSGGTGHDIAAVDDKIDIAVVAHMIWKLPMEVTIHWRLF
jgi:hypothetical protein